ncbi:HAMP domain-containing sensor histidine kinase [Bordetella sp. FB-8]|uniref:sensor histidine kinase n=1 Tax=Bordetella sp. FB-8 TaxID=1159870 RepID=UPI00037B34FD|nr:ATP-binding protein [Bordetella sp. FB-8]
MNHSLQFRLSASIAAGIALVALLGAFLSFLLMLREADNFQDSQLRQIAALINSRYLPSLPDNGGKVQADDDVDARIFVQQMSPDSSAPSGRRAQAGPDAPNLPPNLHDGLQTVFADGVSWRVLVKPVSRQVRIAIAQPTSEREEIARHSAMVTLAPLLLLIPVLIFLSNFLVRKMFRSVVRLAEEVNLRSDQDLRTLDCRQIPFEVVPFALAINRLFTRVALAIEHQRRFIADAAHELRSPLTALSLQVERLAAVPLPEAVQERVGLLQQGISRARSLIEQLLTLARVQQVQRHRYRPVSLQSMIRQVVEELMPLVEQKQIDLEMVGDDDLQVPAQELDLKTLVKNLLDNAIRYTPERGHVTLHISAENGGLLEIRDTGPGIPEAERRRVFDAFYRIPGNSSIGSGLGLAIVKTIADRIGASVGLNPTPASAPRGLAVKVAFRLGL